MVVRDREVQGVRVPTFIYGTAWKEEKTAELTAQALAVGFTGVDTANQRRHYFEAAVGEALAVAMASGRARADLFVQTKFTYPAGQDHRLPYDPRATVAEQVAQSFASSLDHLGITYVDSYVLHGPSRRVGLAPEDLEAWRAMEALHQAGTARLLGISNVARDQLEELWDKATVKPKVVQNRCFAVTGWDHEVRAFCADHQVLYQGFSLLTANPQVLQSDRVRALAARRQKTPAQIVFRFALQAGMVALTGSSSRAHLAQDLAAYDFALDLDEVADIARMAR